MQELALRLFHKLPKVRTSLWLSASSMTLRSIRRYWKFSRASAETSRRYLEPSPSCLDNVGTLRLSLHESLFINCILTAKWKRFRALWKLEKTIVMEKFAAKNPSCVAYDDKLLFYSKIAEEVFNQATPRVSFASETIFFLQ